MGKTYKPTAEQQKQVSTMAGLGNNEKDIALVMDISNNTLRRHYKADLTKGRSGGIVKVTGALMAQCLKGNMAAIQFYLRTVGGWDDGTGRAVKVEVKREVVTLVIGEEDQHM